jgi:O-antigen/teichoic acid export membrane protein
MSNVQLEASEKTSSRMLRATAVIGGSNVVATFIRIVRTKVFAICLGPAGMGLVGLYTSVMSTATTLAEMGVGSSGVRQIAEANGDENKMAGTLFSLRAVTAVLGIIGALLLVFLSRTISRRVFGNFDYAIPLAVLSVGVLFQIISDSQMALLNGLRRVGDLARINVIGSAIGTFFAIIIVWVKGEHAIAWAVIIPVLSALACSSWFVKGIRLPRRRPPWKELKTEVLSLLRIGLAFMVTGLMMTGALLLTRMIFVERLGLVATGLFQAAWGIAVTNIDFILNAMGIDFYPHLTSCVKRDQPMGNRLVNEQMEVALLLGGPLIIGMLSFAGPLIHVFFSGRFVLATELLRWLVLGSVLKLVSWPISFLILAQGWAVAYMVAEFVWCFSYVILIYAGSTRFGVNSAGYAFAAAYLIYGLVVYIITHSLSDFRVTWTNLRLFGSLSMVGIIVIMLGSRNAVASYLGGGLATLAFGIVSVKRLSSMVDHPIARRISQFIVYNRRA